ncbi:MAG: hypothetical protein MUC60_08380, partial [Oscillatoria sp. Prado101]|nr:hypothetical protein [Oscillatoria sp. Prado101]
MYKHTSSYSDSQYAGYVRDRSVYNSSNDYLGFTTRLAWRFLKPQRGLWAGRLICFSFIWAAFSRICRVQFFWRDAGVCRVLPAQNICTQ